MRTNTCAYAQKNEVNKLKKRLYSALIVLTMLLSLLPVNTVFAETVASGSCGDNATWTLDSEGTLTVSGSGKMTDYSASEYIQWTKDCKSVIIGDEITHIGDYSFSGCSKLTQVIIGNNVQTIGKGSFKGSSITKLKMPNSIQTIGFEAFRNCSALKLVNFGTQLKNIDTWAFQNCTTLEILEFPEDIAQIGYYAFGGCKNLKSVIFPTNSTISVGENVFAGCSMLSFVKLSNNTKILSDNMFSGCDLLQNITIPEGVEEIGAFAFADCTALKCINIPGSIKTIDCWAFKNCTGLEEVHISNVSAWCNISFKRGSWDVFEVNPLYYAQNLYIDKKLVTDLIIPDNVTQIPDYAFVNCSSITSITVPKSVTSIGASAFANCNSIKTVNYCGNSSEWDAINLSGGNDTLGTANKIYNYVASGSCGDNATWTLDSAGTLTVSGTGEIEVFSGTLSTPLHADTPWKKYNEYIKSVVISNGITRIDEYTFCDCVNMEKVKIADTVTAIGYYAFLNCDKLSTVDISKNITNIASFNPFADCDSLKQIRVSNQNAYYKSVNGILYNRDGTRIIAFPNLATYSDEILSGVTSISYASFRGNTTIESMNFPETISYVGFEAFMDSKLKKVNLNEGLKTIEGNGYIFGAAFSVCNSIESIHFPSTLQDIPEISSLNLKDITFSEKDTMSYKKFGGVNGCENLEEVSLPNSIEGCAAYSFNNCLNLKNVHLPNKLKGISSCMFKNCTALTNVEIPENVVMIYANAFENCNNLKTVTIPKALTQVRDNAFTDCNSLDTIYYAGTPDEWNAIDISSAGNDTLNYANIVYNYTPTTIVLNKTELSLHRGESEKLTVTTSPNDADVLWNSDNNNVATISVDGTVTATGIGKATITATANNGAASVSCIVNVLPVSVTGITLDKTEASIKIGSTSKLNATVTPDNAENKNIIWSSENSDIVSVDESGNITAKSIGTAVVTATTEVGNFTAKCKVTVLPIAVSGIKLEKTELSIAEGATTRLNATVLPENATDKSVLWSSSNEKVATVENGTITALSQGTAVIIATTKDGNYTAYCAVTVTAANIPVKSVSLSQSTLTIVEGYTDVLTATILPSDATNQNIMWSTNNSNVATVDNGTITAVSPGTAVIIATTEDGGRMATCIVNVISAMQDSVSKPIASILSGPVKEGANVLLLCGTRGAQIHYTTDGSAPTKESPLYGEPIQINSAVKIKAIAVKNGMLDSDVASLSYTIADPTVPYVSVQTNLTGNKGDVTTVSVNISENSGSAGGSFNLVYDNSAVELLSVENGAYISKANPIVNDTYATNKVRTVWAGSKALAGGGEILTAQFRILDDTNKDAAYFSLEKLKLADDNAVKMKCLQSDGVLALMTAESTVPDKEFVTESILGEDNKTVSITVTSNGENTGKMYVAVYDSNNKLMQLRNTDVKNNIIPYDIVFDKEVQQGQFIKIFVWDTALKPLSDVEMLQK